MNPVLAALERGNELQRVGVLASFDGSFFKGRFYARQPENMLDVGNDREFGFLYEVPLDQLERMFKALLAADLPSESKRQAIQLSSFFKLPDRTRDESIQARLLEALKDREPTVREAARSVVSGELSLAGVELEPRRVEALRRMLLDPGGTPSALLAAIGRNPRLVARPEILEAIRRLMPREEMAADLLPVIGRPEFSDTEMLTVLDHGWKRFSTQQKLSCAGSSIRPPGSPGSD